MITLKEAFRQQKFLADLQSMCWRYLADRNFYTKTVEKHLRAKVLPGQEKEDVDVSEPRRYAVQEVIDFCRCLMDEEEKLASAVHKAKSSMDFDLDTAVVANRSRRQLAARLKQETGFEATHALQRSRGTGYVLDKDGKPTTFSYDIDVVTARLGLNYTINRFITGFVYGEYLRSWNSDSDYMSSYADYDRWRVTTGIRLTY